MSICASSRDIGTLAIKCAVSISDVSKLRRVPNEHFVYPQVES